MGNNGFGAGFARKLGNKGGGYASTSSGFDSGLVASTLLPNSVRGLVSWYVPGVGVTLATTSSLVTQWEDVGGNNHHFTQSVDGRRPSYFTQTSSYVQPAIRFVPGTASTTSCLETDAWGGDARTFYIVADIGSGVSPQNLVACSNRSTTTGSLVDSTNLTRLQNGGSLNLASPVTRSLPSVWCCVVDPSQPTSSSITRNSVTSTYGNAGTNTLYEATYRIGANFSYTSGLNGSISELIIYNVAHTTDEQAKVLRYIATAHSLSVSGL
jgi:hypothetical protein